MALLTIESLLERKAELDGKKKLTYEIATTLGIILVKAPSASLLSEAAEMSKGNEGDAFLVYNCVLSPSLSDSKLQEAYGAVEPFDIVGKIFAPGEIRAIANALTELAGYGKTRLVPKVHDAVKN